LDRRTVIAIIATKSHLGPAATLAGGIVAETRKTRIELVLVDASEFEAQKIRAWNPNFSRVRCHDEFVGPADYAEIRRRYSLAETCFCLKPRVLNQLLDEGADIAIYLDTDIGLYAPIRAIADALDRHAIALTPHLTAPLPEDHHLPRDITILRAGAFNLGFVGVANHPEAYRFLRWWTEREMRYGYVDPYYGWGGDQKWCDLVPALFDEVAILKSPGLNVGYWNLPSRPLSKKDGKWLAGGEPLVFFHFSGFDPGQPHILSKFQDRIDPARDPLLAELLKDYAMQLLESGRELAPLLAQLPENPLVSLPPSVDGQVADPLQAEQYAVTIAVQPTRLVVEPGEVAFLQVLISNPADAPLWIARHSDGVRGIGLSFHLFRASGELLTWDNPRQHFSQSVPARGSFTFEFRYQIPLEPGQFTVEIDLVHEGHCWFGGSGAHTARCEVFAGVLGGTK